MTKKSKITSNSLNIAFAGIHDGFDARLKEVDFLWAHSELTVSGNFMYIAFRDGLPTMDEFVDFICNSMIQYCIPRSERDEADVQYKKTGDYRYILELYKKAKRLFIQGMEEGRISGEAGELILFIFLEVLLKAPQAVSKMYLKTSPEMPVHGSDAIHVYCDHKTGNLYHFWGESKLVPQLSSALDDVCDSIDKFLTKKNGRSPRDRDIDILRDHMSITDEKTKQAIKNYLNPYHANYNKRIEVYSCLVGAECVYSKLKGKSKSEVEAIFEKEYLVRIKTACQLFEKKIIENKFSELNFHFFLLPFDDIDTFRKKFLAKLKE